MKRAKILTDVELSLLLSEHEVGRLVKGTIHHSGDGPTCALGTLSYLNPNRSDFNPSGSAYGFYESNHRGWIAPDVYSAFDRRYRKDMEPESFIAIWDDVT